MSEIIQLHKQFCEYSLAFKNNTPRTVKWFEEVFRFFVKGTGVQCIQDVSKEMIEHWIIKGKIEKNWSPKTIRTRIAALKSFFTWCVEHNYITDNPVNTIHVPKIPAQIPQHLTREKAESLLEWTRNYPYSYVFERSRASAIIAIFIFTGVRLSELMNLKMIDVDIENKVLFVRQGKGQKDRMIPIPNKLISILKAYLKDRKRLKKTCPYFFTSMREDIQIQYINIRRLVEKLRKSSKIPFHPHMLRHTFAVLMLEGGCDLFSLSKMMGDSDIKTTTIYLYATTAHLKEQINKHPLNDMVKSVGCG